MTKSPEKRFLSAILGDISSLNITIKELNKLGIRHSFIFTDAGFFSEGNIKDLYMRNINFLTRLPATTIVYKELIGS